MGYVKAVLLFFALVGTGFVFAMVSIFQWGNATLNRRFMRSFSFWVKKIVGLKFQIENEDRLYLHRPAILTSNHQTGLDLGIIGTLAPPNSVIVAKRELLYIPFFGWMFLAAGNILINRSRSREAKEAITSVIDRLKNKNLNLIIFPEGTRNKGAEDELLPFKKGMFHLSVQSGFPIIPVVCSSLKRVAIWENYELQGGTVYMSVLMPIFPRPIPAGSPTEVRSAENAEVSRLTAEVRALMQAELIRLNLKR
jgi:lysophosphatidate acyltransferase